MADCSNVEIRELLPERAGSALSVADTARVEAHLAACELCASELALIQSARRALRVSPTIDVRRITTAVLSATAAPSRPQLVQSGARSAAVHRRPPLRWVGWKAAAAIAIAAAGAGSFAVWSSANESSTPPNGGAGTVAQSPANVTAPAVGRIEQPTVSVAGALPAAVAPAELAVAGDLADLSDGDLQALLGDLSGADAQAIADPSFDEPETILPSVGAAVDEESI
jgi:hypothetical protein